MSGVRPKKMMWQDVIGKLLNGKLVISILDNITHQGELFVHHPLNI